MKNKVLMYRIVYIAVTIVAIVLTLTLGFLVPIKTVVDIVRNGKDMTDYSLAIRIVIIGCSYLFSIGTMVLGYFTSRHYKQKYVNYKNAYEEIGN